MSSFGKDSRFSRVLTDPRFLPMPTYEKKVKIDKRFNAIFTSKDFGHRTLLDKRGRPIHDVSKRGKHVMQQFYELSSDEDQGQGQDSSDESEDSDEDEDEEGKGKESGDDVQVDSKVSKKKQKKEASSAENNEVKKQLKKKNKKPDEDIDTSISNKKSKAKVAKLTKHKGKEEKQTTKRTHDDEDNEMDSRKPERAAKKMKKEEITKPKAKKKSADDDKSEEDSEGGEEEETSESDDSSDEDDDELPEYTTEFDLEETAVEHKWNELHADAPEVSESTRRLAVCNMDWDFVKAQDLYVLFKSFATEGGSVHSVTIYPSEFGKERMADEAVHGPKELRDSLKNGTGGGPIDAEKKKKKKDKYVDPQKLKRMEKQMVDADREVLRDYQMNRMRYYYAVVDCSSVEVADNIYKECDGQEYQLSAVKLDLRFIPDAMTFDDVPKESFGEEQGLVDYTPRLFYSSALSQAKVEVTWDETDFDRLHRKMVHFQHKDLENIVEENKYADIIAPPESDSDMDDEGGRPQWLKSVLADDEDEEDITEERKISMYRKVIMDKLVEEEEKEQQENEVDKELEWQPGLKSAVQNKLKKSEKAKGTLVDDFLEKKKEKRKKKRDLKKAELAKAEKGDDDDDEVGDDFDVPGIMDDQLKEMMESEGVDLSSLKEKKGKKKDKKKKGAEENKDDSEDEREKAELELLLMGDGEEKKVGKPEKVQEGKLSRRQKQKKSMLAKKEKMKVQEDLEVDVDDPRFSAMFSSHHFHIDPSAPEFKKTNNMMKLVDEQIKRKPEAKKDGGARKNNDGDANDMTDSKSVSKKLVESLKRKMKKNK